MKKLTKIVTYEGALRKSGQCCPDFGHKEERRVNKRDHQHVTVRTCQDFETHDQSSIRGHVPV